MDELADFQRRFLDSEGKLKQLPSKPKYREAAVKHLASKFESDKQYSESEVNDIIAKNHSFNDITMLRRELVSARILAREKDGSKYWLV